MGFCPVCGAAGQTLHPRCERVGRYYGYSPSELAQLAAREMSIAVPFFDVKRLLFSLDTLAQHPMAPLMVAAVEQQGSAVEPQEFGNLVRVLPFSDPDHPQWHELYVKEDVSKTMVVYQYQDAIEHLGSEERAVAFAEIADRFFGLGEHVPPAAMGLSTTGAKFVVSAGLDHRCFSSLGARPRDLADLWRRGILARLALLDFVLGQNDRNSENVLVSEDGSQLGLIDNDDCFVAHERLVGRFAYLDALAGDGEVDVEMGAGIGFDVARDWFRFSLPGLLAVLSPMALPEPTMDALCRRFAFAQKVVAEGFSVRDFVHAAFVERPPSTWHLPSVPWTLYRPLVKETAQGTFYRTLVGEARDGSYVVTVLDGRVLHSEVTPVEATVESSQSDAEAAVASLTVAGLADGYIHVLRRRFFVPTGNDPCNDELRIVEVRDDMAGCHVIVKEGHLGYYGARRVGRFISFESSESALAKADLIEGDLTSSGFADLRSRLASFKTSGPTAVFF